MQPRERILSRLAMGDDVTDLPAPELGALGMTRMEPRDAAMVRLGALLALDASASSLHRATQDALGAGVSLDEIVRCMVSLVPTLGVGRSAVVAPSLALAIGFDLEAAIEEYRPGE